MACKFLLDRASEIANKENLKLASVCYYGIKYIEKNGSVAKFRKSNTRFIILLVLKLVFPLRP
jgi:hypothetical protein